MTYFILPHVILPIFILCSASGHKGRNHHHRYGHYHGYGQHHNNIVEQIPNVNTIPPVNICPQIICPQFIPLNCRKASYQNVYGVMCRGCDVNVCLDPKVDAKPVEPVLKNTGPERGDIPKVPKFLNQINGQFNGVINSKPVLIPNTQVQSSNGILWQNNIPVWQNSLAANGQLQSNVPPHLQWNDALVNTQWQNVQQLPGNVPVNNQWQNSMNMNGNFIRTVPVNSQLATNNPQVAFAFNTVNTLPEVSSGFPMPMISVTGTLINGDKASGPWEKGPFQPPLAPNKIQSLPAIPNIASIPQDSSLPVFKNSQSIGTPINGLPMQITGKSVESSPVRVESDQNLGLTNSLYGVLHSSDMNINSQVYKANSPDVFNGIGPVGGK